MGGSAGVGFALGMWSRLELLSSLLFEAFGVNADVLLRRSM